MSSGNWKPSDPACLPVRLGSLPDTHSSRPAGASLLRIDWFRSRFRYAGNGSSEPCSSPDRRRNCDYGHSAESLADDASVLNTAPENGIAPYGFGVVAVLYALVRDSAVDLDADRIASLAAAVAQSVAADSVVKDGLAVAQPAVAADCSGSVAAGRAPAAACSGSAAARSGSAAVVAQPAVAADCSGSVAAGRAPAAACSGSAAVVAQPAVAFLPGLAFQACPAFRLAAPAVRGQERWFREARIELLC